MTVAVAGASGFVGRRLCPALEAAGHPVRAITRRPETYAGAGVPVYGDVRDSDSLDTALAGCDAAYYLVHSLGDVDFARRDDRGARAFARRPPGRGWAGSSISEVSARTTTTCPSTCAAAATSSRSSAPPVR